MAMNPYGTAGQIGPQNLQYFSGQGEANDYAGFNIGDYNIKWGRDPWGGEGQSYGWLTNSGMFNTDLNALLAQLGVGTGHQGYGMGPTATGDGTQSYNLQSTSPFYTPDVQNQLFGQYFGVDRNTAMGMGGLDFVQAGNHGQVINPDYVFNDPTYGYITPGSNYQKTSTFKQLAPLAAVLAAPFAYSALAGLGGGAAGASGGSLGGALTQAANPAALAGTGAASNAALTAPLSLAGVSMPFPAASVAGGALGGDLFSSLGLGADPGVMNPQLLAAQQPGAGMLTPASAGMSGSATLGPTLQNAASLGVGAAGPSLGLDALSPSWGANPVDPLTAALGIGPSPATLNPAIASLSQAAPYASSASQLAAGAGIPTVGAHGSIWNSAMGMFSSLFDDPKELLKLLGSGALSYIGGNQQEKIAGQAAQQADPYAAFRPGDAAQFQQVQNATNFDNPIYNAMRDQMERATIRRGAQGGNLGSASLVNELMTRNAALFNDYRSQELQRLGLTSGAFRDPAMAAQILGGGKAAGLATKYGGAIDAISDFLTPDDPYRDLILTMMRR